MTDRPVALVTGCSTGIGEASAVALARGGFRVVATGRDPARLGPLLAKATGTSVLRLDVTRRDSIDAAVRQVLKDHGRLDVLVNNAGYALLGAVEDTPFQDLLKLFATNVFGLVQLTQAVLPVMRRQGGGRVINMSSLAGKLSVPMEGPYCGSKFAVEAISDALRIETRRFGVHVVVIEPGPVVTNFVQNALASSRHILERKDSAYAKAYDRVLKDFGMPWNRAATAEDVARVVLRAARARRPKARYVVRRREAFGVAVANLLPRRVLDWAITRYMGLDVA